MPSTYPYHAISILLFKTTFSITTLQPILEVKLCKIFFELLGAIYYRGVTSIIGANNNFTLNQATYGGAWYVGSMLIELENTSFVDNTQTFFVGSNSNTFLNSASIISNNKTFLPLCIVDGYGLYA